MLNKDPIKLVNYDDVVAANDRFNYFHDGFLKAIRVVSGNEFLADKSWESHRKLVSPDEEADATGLCLMNTVSVELEVHHYNYDIPRQPRRRAVFVKASEAEISDRLFSVIGRDIFELVFDKTADGLACILTCHEKGVESLRTMANGETITIFTAHEIDMVETEWIDDSSTNEGV